MKIIAYISLVKKRSLFTNTKHNIMKKNFNEMTTTELKEIYDAEMTTLNGKLTWEQRERLVQVYKSRTFNLEEGIKTIFI